MQTNWRWCRFCEGLFFTEGADRGACPGEPAGHDASESGAYAMLMTVGYPGVQYGWAFCKRCQGLYFAKNGSAGSCPRGGGHDRSDVNGQYGVPHGDLPDIVQPGWRHCRKCEGLFFGENPTKGRCPHDQGAHDPTGSGAYGLPWEPSAVVPHETHGPSEVDASHLALPGVDALGCGYDAGGRSGSAFSVRRRLLDLGRYDQSKAIEGRSGPMKTYWYPSSVEYTRGLGARSQTASGRSIEELASSYTHQYVGDVGTLGYSSAFSSMFSMNEFSRTDRFYTVAERVFDYWSLRLRETHLRAHRQMLTDQARSDLSHALDADEVIARYGTHYIIALSAGARASLSCSTDVWKYGLDVVDASESQEDVNVLFETLDENRRTVQTERQRRLREASVHTLSTEGGDPGLTAMLDPASMRWENAAAWASSIESNIVMCGFPEGVQALVPIESLCDDLERRYQIQLAAQRRLQGDKRHGPWLSIHLASKLLPVARNDGMGAGTCDLMVSLPQVRHGFFHVGQVGQASWGEPKGPRVEVADVFTGTALAPPIDFVRVWSDEGSGNHNGDYAIWRPVAPPGYVALGDLFSRAAGWSKPTRNSPEVRGLMCVRRDLVVPATLGDLLWTDRGSRAPQNVSLYPIIPEDEGAISAGTFYALPNYDAPPSPPEVFCLRATGRPA